MYSTFNSILYCDWGWGRVFYPKRNKVNVLVTQSCLTLYDPMDWNSLGSSAHGLLQARIPEWVTIPFSMGSSLPRDWTQVSCIVHRFFTIWVTRRGRLLKDSQILLNHKKEQNNAICSDIDGHRDCHTEWRKSGRKRQISDTKYYMISLMCGI